MVAFVLPALGNGAWVILLTLHMNGSRKARGGSAAANGEFGVPARLVRPLGRLAGALVALIGGFVAYLTYENASETARAASAVAGAVTPRTRHLGWYLAIVADGVAAFGGLVACLFGRGAPCGPSKRQLSKRDADDEYLRVVSTEPEYTRSGVIPRDRRAAQPGGPSPAGEARWKRGGGLAPRQPEWMEKPEASFSHASRVSERERVRERAVRERAAASGGGGGGRRWRYGGEASGAEAGASSGEEGASSDESSGTGEDVERGRRRAGTSARARVPDPAGGRGGWDSWKAAFWKSSAGAAAAAAAAARARGGGNGSSSGVSEPEEIVAHRAERDARAARLKRLVQSPATRAARPRARALDPAQPARTIADASCDVTGGTGAPRPTDAATRDGALRAREGDSRRRTPIPPVYELSSSDEEFPEPARPSESPDSVAEARAPLLSPVVPGTRGRPSGSGAEPEALSPRRSAEPGRRA